MTWNKFWQGVAAFVILLPLLLLYQGFVFMTLWNWFITQEMSLAVAIGVILIKAALFWNTGKATEFDHKKFLSPLLFLAIGYIIHTFFT